MTSRAFLRKMSMEVLTVERSVSMKNHLSTNWIRIALLCMALTIVVSLMIIPLLAKGIWHDPLPPEKVDIRPIPVPVAPVELPLEEPSVTVTTTPVPSQSAVVPVVQAVPVPTPATQVTLPNSTVSQNSTFGAAPRPSIPVVTSRGAIAGSVMFILLLFLIGWRRASSFRYMHQECAS